MVVFESTTPSLRDTPPVPGGELLLLLFLLLIHSFTTSMTAQLLSSKSNPNQAVRAVVDRHHRSSE